MNGIVEFASVRVGGNRIDEAIMSYVKRKYNLMIGEQTAETVKIHWQCHTPGGRVGMEVRGRDQVSGLPKTIRSRLARSPRRFRAAGLDRGRGEERAGKTPPNWLLTSSTGASSCRGGALLRNFHRLLTKETGVPCYVADNPIACVALARARPWKTMR